MLPNTPLAEQKSPEISGMPSSDKITLYGDASTGKSTSIATTLINPPEERRIIYVMTERNAPLGFEWGLRHYGITPKPGQILYVAPEEEINAGFANLARSVKSFTSKPQGLKHDPRDSNSKEKYGFLQKILDSLANFSGIDYVTQEVIKIGNIGSLSSKDILVIDGLSPIASEVWNTLYGDVLLYSGYDYGPAQQLLYKIFWQLSKIKANVILLAHEKNYLEGEGLNTKLKFIGPDTKVGEANFTSLMGTMTDVIRAKKFGTKFVWEGSGVQSKAYCIARTLPVKDNLEPNFSLYEFFQ